MISTSKHNKKIPIIEMIEDDPTIRSVLREVLQREGFITYEARNGEEGLEIALRVRPNLIVLDIRLPFMDGLAVMKKLREGSGWGSCVPIIMLTNLDPDNDRINQAITDHEPAYYVVKSNSTMMDIVEKIKERLSRNESM